MALAEAHLGIKKLLGVQVWGEDTESCAWVSSSASPVGWGRGTGCHTNTSEAAPGGLGVSSHQLRVQLCPRGQGWVSPVTQSLTRLQPQALAQPGTESRFLEERRKERRAGRVALEGGDAPSTALIALCALPAVSLSPPPLRSLLSPPPR